MAARKATAPTTGTDSEKEKTTINLPRKLKRKAQHHALETGQDLQDLIAEGLRLVLARDGGR